MYKLTSKDDSSCSEIMYIQTKCTQCHCRSDQHLSVAVALLKADKYLVQKYSNKLSMKALVEKDILMKKQEKEMRKAPHFFYVHLSRELEGTWVSSREALLEVMEGKIYKGKKTQEKLEKNSGNGRKKLSKWHEYSIGKNSQI